MGRRTDASRIAIRAVWLFLIVAGAIAAETTPGDRIVLARRFFAMDLILDDVLRIRCLAAVVTACLIEDVWKDYRDGIVLERISLGIASAAPRRPPLPLGPPS